MNNQSNILVSICCITYNQAPYIRQCLDGFIMQKTNFKFEIIVHDDCSTDGTTDIVKEYADKYPDLIVPILQTVNQYQNGNNKILATFVYPKATGKYIALCEGDDYWIDPGKLQRQVDFLESHQDYVAVAENGKELNMQTNELYLFSLEKERDLTIEEMVIQRRFPTASILFRSSCLGEDLKKFKKTLDTGFWCYIASKGKFRYMENVSSVYRRGSGVTVTSDPYLFAQQCEIMYLEIIDHLGEFFNKKVAYDAIYNGYLYSLPRYVHLRSFTRNFWACLFTCIKRKPTRLISYFFSRLYKVILMS